jgi:hypothetical protein
MLALASFTPMAEAQGLNKREPLTVVIPPDPPGKASRLPAYGALAE